MSELLSALIGTIIGAIGSFLLLRFNYRQLFANVVSENRIEWMNSLRTNLSKFLANAEILREIPHPSTQSKDTAQQYFTLKCSMFEARELVTTRLNLAKEQQHLLFVALKNLDYMDDNFIAQREYIEELARKILRPEWESVKNEAKGKKY